MLTPRLQVLRTWSLLKTQSHLTDVIEVAVTSLLHARHLVQLVQQFVGVELERQKGESVKAERLPARITTETDLKQLLRCSNSTVIRIINAQLACYIYHSMHHIQLQQWQRCRRKNLKSHSVMVVIFINVNYQNNCTFPDNITYGDVLLGKVQLFW